MNRSEWIVNYLTGKVCEAKDIQEFFRLEGVEQKTMACPHCNQIIKLSTNNSSNCVKGEFTDNTMEFIVNGYNYWVDFIKVNGKEIEIVNVKATQIEE